MALPDFVLDQLARPSGILGPLAAGVLDRLRAATVAEAVAALEVTPGDRVLDLGFRGGASLVPLLRAVGPDGQVFALEDAPQMLLWARRRHVLARLRGRLRLERAKVEQLPLGDGSFERVLALHTLAFWTDVDAAFGELARVLADGGRLVLGVPDPALLRRLGFAERGYRVAAPERVAARLPRDGFAVLEQRPVAGETTLLIAERRR